MAVATAYPLAWPPTIRRSATRDKGRFQTTLPRALENVQRSLRLFGKDSGKPVERLVISSNYALGMPNPADAGVAVYFVWDGLQVAIPIDRYARLEDNLQAVHHIIEARRVELRHGTLQLVRATLTGFAALPPPSPGARPWWEILGVPQSATRSEIVGAHKRLALKVHPDAGGTTSEMAALNAARDEALRAVGP
jgi:DnaJ-like protein